VALFACQALGLREVLPVRRAFEDAFVVGEAPYLRPLVAAVGEAPSAVVVFVDAERARLMPLTAEGSGEEAVLAPEVPGHHRRGGWAQLAQSRYQRHIQDHRERHLEAVSEALRELTRQMPGARIVLAGEPRILAVFRKELPSDLADRVVGSIAGSQHEAASTFVERASSLLALHRGSDLAAEVDRLLVEAEKGGRAAAGLGAVLRAGSRRAIQRLYLLGGFSAPGRACSACGGLQRGADASCRLCGGATTETELGEAVVSRVIADGGAVEILEKHAGLARADGVAALLRYSL
jgi:peptide subunit release factor 1 (eRF1)